jgi:NAD(P)-dependent dehydrogenase (short-subunit alcohol dehydrogenase family)
MDRRFSGKVAIVTGGASGIGEATARRLAEEGAAVVVADLNGEGASRVAAAIASAGGRAIAQTCDVSREDEIVACVERAVEEFGGLDIMHNNAADTSHATMAADAVAVDSDAEYFEHVFRVNVIGVMLGCKHAIPRLLERGGGAIINTSSGAALQSRPQGGTAYAASKAAVESITRSVAVQYGKQGIRCNGIAPGITPHDHARASLGDEMLDVMSWANSAPALGTVEQQAAAVAFLASDDAAYLNGHTLPVDGGSQVLIATTALVRFAHARGVLGRTDFGQAAEKATAT